MAILCWYVCVHAWCVCVCMLCVCVCVVCACVCLPAGCNGQADGPRASPGPQLSGSAADTQEEGGRGGAGEVRDGETPVFSGTKLNNVS